MNEYFGETIQQVYEAINSGLKRVEKDLEDVDGINYHITAYRLNAHLIRIDIKEDIILEA